MDLTPYDLPAPVLQSLLDLAAGADVLLIGETHGTREVPRLVAALLDPLAALGYGGLGLEMARDQRDALAAWAAGAATPPPPPPFFAAPWPDGRGNAQALALTRAAAGRGYALLRRGAAPPGAGPDGAQPGGGLWRRQLLQLRRTPPPGAAGRAGGRPAGRPGRRSPRPGTAPAGGDGGELPRPAAAAGNTPSIQMKG